jgi:hypothetical protein
MNKAIAAYTLSPTASAPTPSASASSLSACRPAGQQSRQAADGATADWTLSFLARVAAAEAAATEAGGSSSPDVIPHCAKCGSHNTPGHWKHGSAGARLCSLC